MASGTAVARDGDHDALVIVDGGRAALSAVGNGASEGLRTLLVDCDALGGRPRRPRRSAAISAPMGLSGGAPACRAYQQGWVSGARSALT